MQIQIPVENILEDRIYVAKEYDSDISSIPDLEALELLAVVRLRPAQPSLRALTYIC